jgi:polar amino acid transport system permease protein
MFAILPQALRRFLPPYVGQLTVLIQASALTSIVGVTDILGSARQMIERLGYVGTDSHAVEIYCAVLVAFFGICYPLTLLSNFLERRLRA